MWNNFSTTIWFEEGSNTKASLKALKNCIKEGDSRIILSVLQKEITPTPIFDVTFSEEDENRIDFFSGANVFYIFEKWFELFSLKGKAFVYNTNHCIDSYLFKFSGKEREFFYIFDGLMDRMNMENKKYNPSEEEIFQILKQKSDEADSKFSISKT
jgi:hypothetical protein